MSRYEEQNNYTLGNKILLSSLLHCLRMDHDLNLFLLLAVMSEEEIYLEQYYQFLRENQLRDLNLLTELPEDYKEHIDYYTKPKELCAENHKPNL